MSSQRNLTRWGVVTLCLLLAGAASPLASANEGAGDRAADEGAYDIAVEEYETALAGNPDDVGLLLKTAEAKTFLASAREGDRKTELFDEAAQHAERAAELEPENPEAHFEHARALGRLAEYTGIFEALDIASTVRSELKRALELDPEHGGALHALALWHFYAPWVAGGRQSEVHRLFGRAIELEPDNVAHRRAYGEVLLELGDRGAAREQLERAVEIHDPSFLGQQDIQRAQELLDENFGSDTPAGAGAVAVVRV